LVSIGFSGLVQLHVRLSQLLEIQEKFVMLNGLSVNKDQLFINTNTTKYLIHSIIFKVGQVNGFFYLVKLSYFKIIKLS